MGFEAKSDTSNGSGAYFRACVRDGRTRGSMTEGFATLACRLKPQPTNSAKLSQIMSSCICTLRLLDSVFDSLELLPASAPFPR